MKWSSIIAIFSTIINILLSGIVCYVVLVMVPCCKSLCADDIIEYLGIFLACISIVITGYFAVLAIKGYEKISRIKDFEKSIEWFKKVTLQNLGSATKTAYEVAIEMVEIYGRSNKDEKSQKKYKKQRLNFKRDYYRLGLKPFLLSNDDRISFISNLRAFAEEEDLEELEKICNSNNELPEIKRVAKDVLDSFNSSEPTIFNQSRWGCIKSRLKTFFKGQCDLFKGLFRGYEYS